MHEIVSQTFDCFSSFEAMFHDMLINNRKAVINRLNDVCGSVFMDVLDSYGEIDEWWTPTSFVVTKELGLSVNIDIKSEKLTIVVYK